MFVECALSVYSILFLSQFLGEGEEENVEAYLPSSEGKTMRARMEVHHFFFPTLLFNLGALRPSISCRKTDVEAKVHTGWKQKKMAL